MIKDLGIIIAAAGSSSRFGGDKLLEEIDGMPVFLHSIRSFYNLCPEGNMVIVVHSDNLEKYKQKAAEYLSTYKLRFVNGAELRADSVRKGLEALSAETGFVAIHDAARPWAMPELLIKCLDAARIHGGAVPAKAVVDTLKRTDENGKIIDTVSRNNLWRVETPQVFNFKKLVDANSRLSGVKGEFTDDASIMEAAGYEVFVVDNHERNSKITYPKDISCEESKNAG